MKDSATLAETDGWEQPFETRPPPPIRIRTGHSYHVDFTITLGQRNASFVQRAMTPLNRYFEFADCFALTPEPGFDAIHSWNAVPLLTSRPFIATFEDYMPRVPDDRRIDWLERNLRDRLLDDRCRALIATSDYALRQFRWQHRDFDRLPELLAKTERIYPATLPRTGRPKSATDRLRLLFVGRDFMRKGGPVLLSAHRQLRAQNIPVETTIVSSLQWSAADYIGPPDGDYVKASLADLDQPGITHIPALPGRDVQKLMDVADFLIFPTFHDTFGFVSIEALAGGTPVIATDTCVMPEIIEHGRNGYLLPFENDETIGKWLWLYGQTDPDYLDAYDGTTKRLSAALSETLASAWDSRSAYQDLSAAALETASSRFHPDIARAKLETLYERFR